jgi:hypothetical protein
LLPNLIRQLSGSLAMKTPLSVLIGKGFYHLLE